MSAKNPTVSIDITARELHVITSLLGWNTPYIMLRNKLSEAGGRMRLATRDKNRATKAARKAASVFKEQTH